MTLNELIESIFDDITEFKEKAQIIKEENEREIKRLKEETYSDLNVYKIFWIENQNILIDIILKLAERDDIQ